MANDFIQDEGVRDGVQSDNTEDDRSFEERVEDIRGYVENDILEEML